MKEVLNNSFVFYATNLQAVEELEKAYPDLAAELLRAIIDYGIYGEYDNSNPVIAAMMVNIGFGIDKAKDRYQAAVENGKKGGRPSIELNEAEVIEKKQELKTWKKVAEYFGVSEQTLKNYRDRWKNPKNPKNLNDNVNVNDNLNDNVNVEVDAKTFVSLTTGENEPIEEKEEKEENRKGDNMKENEVEAADFELEDEGADFEVDEKTNNVILFDSIKNLETMEQLSFGVDYDALANAKTLEEVKIAMGF